MKNYCLLLMVGLLFSCGNNVEENIQYDLMRMNLGKELYKSKCLNSETYKQADSAYSADAEKFIRESYNKVYQEAEPQECIKVCCHIFFNKDCQYCEEYKLKVQN